MFAKKNLLHDTPFKVMLCAFTVCIYRDFFLNFLKFSFIDRNCFSYANNVKRSDFFLCYNPATSLNFSKNMRKSFSHSLRHWGPSIKYPLSPVPYTSFSIQKGSNFEHSPPPLSVYVLYGRHLNCQMQNVNAIVQFKILF